MHMLARHQLPMRSSCEAAETGRHLSRFLASSNRVMPLDGAGRAAQVGGIRIGAFSIAVIAFGAAASLEARSQGDYGIMVACLEGSCEVEANGRSVSLRANQGHLARPLGMLRARFSRDCVRLVVRIEPSLLDRHGLSEDASFDLTQPALGPWFDFLRLLLSSPTWIASIAQDPCVREHVEALLATLFQRTFLPAIREWQQRPSSTPLVRRAEEFIRQNLARDLTVEDIAEAARVSARTLQAGFKRHHGISPMRFMRDLRLNVAHAQILAGSSVTAAAADCGIPHVGRFAQYYRSRFGHLPHMTECAR